MTAVSKVTLNGTTLMDATTATASANEIILPYTAMTADGVMTTGTASGGYNVQDIAFNREPSGAITIVPELTNAWRFSGPYAFAFKPITSVVFDVTGKPQNVDYSVENQALRNTDITEITDSSFVGFNGASFVPYSSLQEMKKLITVDTSVLWNFKGFGSCFMNDSALTRISIPNAYGDSASAVCQGCNSLEYADLGSVNRMLGNAFRQDYKLQTLILRNTTVVNLGTAPSSSFYQTPFLGYNDLTADLYVPHDLISSYQTATNWSTLLSNGYTTIHAIEGSEYEL